MQKADADVIGTPKAEVTGYRVRRKNPDGEWEWLGWAEDGDTPQYEFAIETLSLRRIKQRFGAGTYRVMFLARSGDSWSLYGNGKIFSVSGAKKDARAGETRPTRGSTASAGAVVEETHRLEAMTVELLGGRGIDPDVVLSLESSKDTLAALIAEGPAAEATGRAYRSRMLHFLSALEIARLRQRRDAVTMHCELLEQQNKTQQLQIEMLESDVALLRRSVRRHNKLEELLYNVTLRLARKSIPEDQLERLGLSDQFANLERWMADFAAPDAKDVPSASEDSRAPSGPKDS